MIRAGSRRHPQNRVLDALAADPTAMTASARLVVDLAHPFFFDHPLDHVPGLLLLEAMHQLADSLRSFSAAAGALPFAQAIEAEFRHYCRLDRPVLVRAAGARTISVWIEQDGRCRAVGRLVAAEGPLPKAASAPAGLNLVPCPGTPLNKHDPANVMIGRPAPLADGRLAAAVLPPQPGNLMGDTESGLYHPLYLLEAFMQMQRFQNSRHREQAPRMRDILRGVAVTLSRVAPSSLPLQVLTDREPPTCEIPAKAALAVREGTILAGEGAAVARCRITTAMFGRAAA